MNRGPSESAPVRIRGGDDDQILGVEQGDELLLGGDVGAASVDEGGGTMRAFPTASCADSSQTACQCAGRAATRGLTDPLQKPQCMVYALLYALDR
jgi:hypothetical protein